ncbi:MAG: alpha-2-macroglobulin family protein [Bacteroidales bacterium]
MNFRIFVFAGILLLAVIASSFTLLLTNRNSSPVLLPPQDFDDYTIEWEQVDALVKKGLPQSALEMVEKIYAMAKQENNQPQYIKSVLYKIKLKSDFEDDFIEKIIDELQAEIAKSETPVKQILHSISADIYWRYYQANRYVFLDRSTTLNIDKDDMQTWDLKTLLNTVIDHYLASMEDEDALKVANLKSYDAILDATKESKKYRPSLFDFLAHRAVDFFINDESSIVQPAYTFELDKQEYFAKSSDFAKLEIKSRDSLSLKFYAMEILQDLTRFHLQDEEPAALVDVDLKRLTFVHQNSTIPEKDELYLKAVENLEKSTIGDPASTDASYVLAVEYNRLGMGYSPLVSDDHKWDTKKAFDKCQEAIKRFPESDGAKNCSSLLSQIEKPALSLSMEKVNLPDAPYLSLVEYKNTKQLFLRIVNITFEENRDLEQANRSMKDLVDKYVSMPFLKSWKLVLPDDGDLQSHATEIKMPELPYGHFIVLACNSENFNTGKDMVAYHPFWVSKISYISQNSTEGVTRFFVLDRESGSAIKNVAAQVYYRTYSYQSREYEYNTGGRYASDAEGYFEIPSLDINARPNSFFIEFTHENDKLVTEDQFYHSGHYPRTERKQTKTWFFTDRAIYRPGQTIYFKGIVLEKLKDQYEIEAGHKTTVEFYDANYQKISELELISNEYGSFNGAFIAPKGVLNGMMTIKNKSGSVNVSIEEYKRPKFEVVFNPVEGSYKLGENVSVTGNARAYAGNAIGQARVSYRVVRQTRFPWRYWMFDVFPVSSTMEISNGILSTNENGVFSIDFTAIPDYSVDAKYKPVFDYKIIADVTDINGETQSSTTHVSVGYTALVVNIGIEDVVDINDLNSFAIKTTNLNGQPTPATGEIIISKLVEPDRLIREKLWLSPDLYTIDEIDFKTTFPHDSYKDDGKLDKFPVESTVASLKFDTDLDSVVDLQDVSSWKPGRYSLKVETKDRFGEKVEINKFFTLFSPSDKKCPVNEMGWFHVIKAKGEPGENASFVIGSGDKNVKVLFEIVRGDSVISRQWITLSNEQKELEIQIKEEFRGGFDVNLIFTKHNRSFNNSFRIEVPFTNKELDFEFATFRDKLLPGQNETWKIKIKGKKGDKVAAELLASMYDASLDALAEHDWYFSLYQSVYSNLSWSAGNTFQAFKTQLYSPNFGFISPVFRQYDQLNWFGFYYYGGSPYGGKKYMDGIGMERQVAPGLNEALEMADSDKTESIDQNSGQSPLFEEQAENPTRDDSFEGVQVRRDFRETAFFFPSLSTNENGDVEIAFEVPESLTKWKLMGMSHTKDLKYGQFEKEVVTQKELMIVPNQPRFFRQGDKMRFSAKVVNLSEKSLSGTATLQFFDARTMNDISKYLLGEIIANSFEIEKGSGQNLEWNITIPEEFDVISYRIMAESGSFSDGEEMPIPVLSNRMLVTESMPLPVKGNESKDFTFKKLLKSGSSGSSIKNFKLTLEFSSNPAWYAIQALPYIMETERESADNVFNRYYANSIASHLVNSNPKIKLVFDVWKNYSPDALLSNLEKNDELKSLILQETPWVLEAKNETERKQRVALLFDLNRMSNELASALRKLQQKQSYNGGWPWFKGMPESWHMTQSIVTGFGHLKQLAINGIEEDHETKQMINKAVKYLDTQIREDYNKLKKNYPDQLQEKHLGEIHIQYLYARTYFLNDIPVLQNDMEAFIYYREQAKKYWSESSIYMKGMIGMALYRIGEKSIPSEIMASMKEHALYSDEMGMYWRDNRGGYYWYEAPIETQALLIEAFDLITGDQKSVEQMKIWLLKQKQTQDWKTGKATAEAVYALLLKGTDWLANDELAEISIGNQTIDPFAMEDTKVEAGTGYFKTSWSGGDIQPEMANVSVSNKNDGIAWGAVYWQYFEDLDKITMHETPLKLEKKLFVERNTDAGPVIEPVSDGMKLSVGDKIKVRIELWVDRNMEYVHMKDMRASAFEPINVLSGYRYQGGLGYYESTLDASTNFFFDYLRKGTYVFEYPLVVSQKGDFSNGITTIQCMYAPEFTSNSEGVRVEVK